MVGLHHCCCICQFFSWQTCKWYDVSGSSNYALQVLDHCMVDIVLCHFVDIFGAGPKMNTVIHPGPPRLHHLPRHNRRNLGDLDYFGEVLDYSCPPTRFT